MSETTRVAIVTGASGGIGRSTAERLAQDGFAVVVGFAGNAARAEETVSAITTAGGSASAFKADIGDEAESASLFDYAEGQYGGVDIVVNAAGIMLLAPLADLHFDDFDRMLRINLRGYVPRQSAGRAPSPPRWSNHQLLLVGSQARRADLFSLCRHQGRG